MKRLGLLLVINLCSAADGIHISQVVLLASLQALMPRVEQPNQSVKPRNAVTPGMSKPVKHKPRKHRINKMYVPNTKPKMHYGH